MKREDVYKFITHCFNKGLIDNDLATVLNYEVEVLDSLSIAAGNECVHEELVFKTPNPPNYTCGKCGKVIKGETNWNYQQ